MEYVDVGPEWGQLPNAFRRGRYILWREARIKMYRMPEDALGSCPPFRPGHTDLPGHFQIRKLF